MNIQEKLKEMGRNSIFLEIAGKESYQRCGSRFGGQPDVPPDFVWPTFQGEGYDGVVKNRPLTFLAQFNCADLSKYDADHLLPDHGLLSFFYETDTQCWGYDPADKGCARVFWFEDTTVLSAADFPEDMEEYFRFPTLRIQMRQEPSYPQWEDFSETEQLLQKDPQQCLTQCGPFEAVRKTLIPEEPNLSSKLLGWPDIIQNSMAVECDLVTQGYYLGGKWEEIPEEVCRRAEQTAPDRWLLLFQLDMVENGDFELMFGDCGRVYFYITREDLLARRFDRVWLILQCC